MMLAILSVIVIASANPLFTDKLNLLTDSGGYANYGTYEVKWVMEGIEGDSATTKLIIGDSVADQLLTGDISRDYLVATGNQAMSFIWQYIFTLRYLDTHPDATDVYLLVTPDSLTAVWDYALSYQYVLMPMVRLGYMDMLDRKSYAELESIYGSFFMQDYVVNLIDVSGINRKLFLNGLKAVYGENEPYTKDSTAISEIAKAYIPKMNAACDEHGVKLHVICCPVKDTVENRKNIELLRDDCSKSDFGSEFPEYFEEIIYYPADKFKDNLHFKDNLLTPEFKREIIEKMKESTGEFSDL